MDTEGKWQDVSVADAEQTKAFNWFRHAPRSLADKMAQSQLKWYGDRDRWQEPNQDVPQAGQFNKQSARQAAGGDQSPTKVHSKTWFRKDVSAGVMANNDAAARIATEVADAAKQVEAAQATAQQAVVTAQQTIQAQAQVQTQLTNQTANAQLTNQTANAQVDLQITADGPNGWKSRLKIQPYDHPIVGDRKLVGRNSRFDEPEVRKKVNQMSDEDILKMAMANTSGGWFLK